MANLLVGIHAALGEFGIFAFLWVLIELLNPTEQRIKRAKIAAVIGVILLFLSWLVGGYYYVSYYGANVKSIIKSGPEPWAHSVFMETKEHVFLFLPFLSMLTVAMIYQYNKKLLKDDKARKSIILLSGLIVLFGLAMAGMGYIISSGARTSLEAGIK